MDKLYEEPIETILASFRIKTYFNNRAPTERLSTLRWVSTKGQLEDITGNAKTSRTVCTRS